MRAEMRCGVAPSFHAAVHASKNSIPLGRAIVSIRPLRSVPAASAYARASLLVRDSRCARVTVVSPDVIAGRAGPSAARSRIARLIESISARGGELAQRGCGLAPLVERHSALLPDQRLHAY